MAGYRGRVKMAFICKKCLPNRLTYGKIANVAKISRHVGMADEADSKSVDGDIVWVQVPLPALNGAKPNPVYFFKKVFAVVVNFTRK